MRHKSREQRQKWNKMMDIAIIIGLLNDGETKRAIDIAAERGISDKQVGIIASYAESATMANITCIAKKIYKQLYTTKTTKI